MLWTCIKMQRIIYYVGMKIFLESNDTQFATTNNKKQEKIILHVYVVAENSLTHICSSRKSAPYNFSYNLSSRTVGRARLFIKMSGYIEINISAFRCERLYFIWPTNLNCLQRLI